MCIMLVHGELKVVSFCYVEGQYTERSSMVGALCWFLIQEPTLFLFVFRSPFVSCSGPLLLCVQEQPCSVFRSPFVRDQEPFCSVFRATSVSCSGALSFNVQEPLCSMFRAFPCSCSGSRLFHVQEPPCFVFRSTPVSCLFPTHSISARRQIFRTVLYSSQVSSPTVS